MGCYELDRFGGDYDAMLEELMSIYQTRPILQVPDGPERLHVVERPARRTRELAA
jgi:hypothetical protein